MPRSQPVDRHGHAGLPRLREIAGMEFDRQLVRAGQFHAARQAPVAEAEPSLRLGVVAPRTAPKHRLHRTLGVGIRSLLPRQGADVGVLGFHRDGEWSASGKQCLHRLLQGGEIPDRHAGRCFDHRIVDRADGEPAQREIAEEERGGRSGKVDHVEPQIRLDMIELRTVAQERDTPAFALQRLEPFLPRSNGCLAHLLDLVQITSGDADRLAVPGELGHGPGGRNTGEAAFKVLVAAVLRRATASGEAPAMIRSDELYPPKRSLRMSGASGPSQAESPGRWVCVSITETLAMWSAISLGIGPPFHRCFVP